MIDGCDRQKGSAPGGGGKKIKITHKNKTKKAKDKEN